MTDQEWEPGWTPETLRKRADDTVSRAVIRDNRGALAGNAVEITALSSLALALYARADTMDMLGFRGPELGDDLVPAAAEPKLLGMVVCKARFGVAVCERLRGHQGAHKEGAVVWGYEPSGTQHVFALLLRADRGLMVICSTLERAWATCDERNIAREDAYVVRYEVL
jgi:hypothetical protein